MKKLLIDSLKKFNVELSDMQAEQLLIYKDILKKWNEKINLTAINDDRDIILKHFVDSLTILSYRNLSGKSVIDVGTGAGFPGMPIKIAEPKVKLTLLESINKKTIFLENLCAELNINDVEIINSRAEDSGRDKKLRESYNFCISRAVADLAVLSEYCLPFVRIGGEFIALKGPNAENEILKAENAVKTLGGEIKEVKDTIIEDADLNHKIIFIKKIKQTPFKYPRNPAKIRKTPII